VKREKERKIKVTESVTEVKIDKRSRELVKILELKESNNNSEYKIKDKILRKNFQGTVERLIKKIKQQRDMILQAYGPLVLNSKRGEAPIFNIMNKERNSNFKDMLRLSSKVP
jgi:hypothetical protein